MDPNNRFVNANQYVVSGQPNRSCVDVSSPRAVAQFATEMQARGDRGLAVAQGTVFTSPHLNLRGSSMSSSVAPVTLYQDSSNLPQAANLSAAQHQQVQQMFQIIHQGRSRRSHAISTAPADNALSSSPPASVPAPPHVVPYGTSALLGPQPVQLQLASGGAGGGLQSWSVTSHPRGSITFPGITQRGSVVAFRSQPTLISPQNVGCSSMMSVSQIPRAVQVPGLSSLHTSHSNSSQLPPMHSRIPPINREETELYADNGAPPEMPNTARAVTVPEVPSSAIAGIPPLVPATGLTSLPPEAEPFASPMLNNTSLGLPTLRHGAGAGSPTHEEAMSSNGPTVVLQAGLGARETVDTKVLCSNVSTSSPPFPLFLNASSTQLQGDAEMLHQQVEDSSLHLMKQQRMLQKQLLALQRQQQHNPAMSASQRQAVELQIQRVTQRLGEARAAQMQQEQLSQELLEVQHQLAVSSHSSSAREALLQRSQGLQQELQQTLATQHEHQLMHTLSSLEHQLSSSRPQEQMVQLQQRLSLLQQQLYQFRKVQEEHSGLQQQLAAVQLQLGKGQTARSSSQDLLLQQKIMDLTLRLRQCAVMQYKMQLEQEVQQLELEADGSNDQKRVIEVQKRLEQLEGHVQQTDTVVRQTQHLQSELDELQHRLVQPHTSSEQRALLGQVQQMHQTIQMAAQVEQQQQQLQTSIRRQQHVRQERLGQLAQEMPPPTEQLRELEERLGHPTAAIPLAPMHLSLSLTAQQRAVQQRLHQLQDVPSSTQKDVELAQLQQQIQGIQRDRKPSMEVRQFQQQVKHRSVLPPPPPPDLLQQQQILQEQSQPLHVSGVSLSVPAAAAETGFVPEEALQIPIAGQMGLSPDAASFSVLPSEETPGAVERTELEGSAPESISQKLRSFAASATANAANWNGRFLSGNEYSPVGNATQASAQASEEPMITSAQRNTDMEPMEQQLQACIAEGNSPSSQLQGSAGQLVGSTGSVPASAAQIQVSVARMPDSIAGLHASVVQQQTSAAQREPIPVATQTSEEPMITSAQLNAEMESMEHQLNVDEPPRYSLPHPMQSSPAQSQPTSPQFRGSEVMFQTGAARMTFDVPSNVRPSVSEMRPPATQTRTSMAPIQPGTGGVPHVPPRAAQLPSHSTSMPDTDSVLHSAYAVAQMHCPDTKEQQAAAHLQQLRRSTGETHVMSRKATPAVDLAQLQGGQPAGPALPMLFPAAEESRRHTSTSGSSSSSRRALLSQVTEHLQHMLTEQYKILAGLIRGTRESDAQRLTSTADHDPPAVREIMAKWLWWRQQSLKKSRLALEAHYKRSASDQEKDRGRMGGMVEPLSVCTSSALAPMSPELGASAPASATSDVSSSTKWESSSSSCTECASATTTITTQERLQRLMRLKPGQHEAGLPPEWKSYRSRHRHSKASARRHVSPRRFHWTIRSNNEASMQDAPQEISIDSDSWNLPTSTSDAHISSSRGLTPREALETMAVPPPPPPPPGLSHFNDVNVSICPSKVAAAAQSCAALQIPAPPQCSLGGAQEQPVDGQEVQLARLLALHQQQQQPLPPARYLPTGAPLSPLEAGGEMPYFANVHIAVLAHGMRDAALDPIVYNNVDVVVSPADTSPASAPSAYPILPAAVRTEEPEMRYFTGVHIVVGPADGTGDLVATYHNVNVLIAKGEESGPGAATAAPPPLAAAPSAQPMTSVGEEAQQEAPEAERGATSLAASPANSPPHPASGGMTPQPLASTPTRTSESAELSSRSAPTTEPDQRHAPESVGEVPQRPMSTLLAMSQTREALASCALDPRFVDGTPTSRTQSFTGSQVLGQPPSQTREALASCVMGPNAVAVIVDSRAQSFTGSQVLGQPPSQTREALASCVMGPNAVAVIVDSRAQSFTGSQVLGQAQTQDAVELQSADILVPSQRDVSLRPRVGSFGSQPVLEQIRPYDVDAVNQSVSMHQGDSPPRCVSASLHESERDPTPLPSGPSSVTLRAQQSPLVSQPPLPAARKASPSPDPVPDHRDRRTPADRDTTELYVTPDRESRDGASLVSVQHGTEITVETIRSPRQRATPTPEAATRISIRSAGSPPPSPSPSPTSLNNVATNASPGGAYRVLIETTRAQSPRSNGTQTLTHVSVETDGAGSSRWSSRAASPSLAAPAVEEKEDKEVAQPPAQDTGDEINTAESVEHKDEEATEAAAQEPPVEPSEPEEDEEPTENAAEPTSELIPEIPAPPPLSDAPEVVPASTPVTAQASFLSVSVSVDSAIELPSPAAAVAPLDAVVMAPSGDASTTARPGRGDCPERTGTREVEEAGSVRESSAATQVSEEVLALLASTISSAPPTGSSDASLDRLLKIAEQTSLLSGTNDESSALQAVLTQQTSTSPKPLEADAAAVVQGVPESGVGEKREDDAVGNAGLPATKTEGHPVEGESNPQAVEPVSHEAAPSSSSLLDVPAPKAPVEAPKPASIETSQLGSTHLALAQKTPLTSVPALAIPPTPMGSTVAKEPQQSAADRRTSAPSTVDASALVIESKERCTVEVHGQQEPGEVTVRRSSHAGVSTVAVAGPSGLGLRIDLVARYEDEAEDNAECSISTESSVKRRVAEHTWRRRLVSLLNAEVRQRQALLKEEKTARRVRRSEAVESRKEASQITRKRLQAEAAAQARVKEKRQQEQLARKELARAPLTPTPPVVEVDSSSDEQDTQVEEVEVEAVKSSDAVREPIRRGVVIGTSMTPPKDEAVPTAPAVAVERIARPSGDTEVLEEVGDRISVTEEMTFRLEEPMFDDYFGVGDLLQRGQGEKQKEPQPQPQPTPVSRVIRRKHTTKRTTTTSPRQPSSTDAPLGSPVSVPSSASNFTTRVKTRTHTRRSTHAVKRRAKPCLGHITVPPLLLPSEQSSASDSGRGQRMERCLPMLPPRPPLVPSRHFPIRAQRHASHAAHFLSTPHAHPFAGGGALQEPGSTISTGVDHLYGAQSPSRPPALLLPPPPQPSALELGGPVCGHSSRLPSHYFGPLPPLPMPPHCQHCSGTGSRVGPRHQRQRHARHEREAWDHSHSHSEDEETEDSKAEEEGDDAQAQPRRPLRSLAVNRSGPDSHSRPPKRSAAGKQFRAPIPQQQQQQQHVEGQSSVDPEPRQPVHKKHKKKRQLPPPVVHPPRGHRGPAASGLSDVFAWAPAYTSHHHQDSGTANSGVSYPFFKPSMPTSSIYSDVGPPPTSCRYGNGMQTPMEPPLFTPCSAARRAPWGGLTPLLLPTATEIQEDISDEEEEEEEDEEEELYSVPPTDEDDDEPSHNTGREITDHCPPRSVALSSRSGPPTHLSPSPRGSSSGPSHRGITAPPPATTTISTDSSIVYASKAEPRSPAVTSDAGSWRVGVARPPSIFAPLSKGALRSGEDTLWPESEGGGLSDEEESTTSRSPSSAGLWHSPPSGMPLASGSSVLVAVPPPLLVWHLRPRRKRLARSRAVIPQAPGAGIGGTEAAEVVALGSPAAPWDALKARGSTLTSQPRYQCRRWRPVASSVAQRRSRPTAVLPAMNGACVPQLARPPRPALGQRHACKTAAPHKRLLGGMAAGEGLSRGIAVWKERLRQKDVTAPWAGGAPSRPFDSGSGCSARLPGPCWAVFSTWSASSSSVAPSSSGGGGGGETSGTASGGGGGGGRGGEGGGSAGAAAPPPPNNGDDGRLPPINGITNSCRRPSRRSSTAGDHLPPARDAAATPQRADNEIPRSPPRASASHSVSSYSSSYTASSEGAADRLPPNMGVEVFVPAVEAMSWSSQERSESRSRRSTRRTSESARIDSPVEDRGALQSSAAGPGKASTAVSSAVYSDRFTSPSSASSRSTSANSARVRTASSGGSTPRSAPTSAESAREPVSASPLERSAAAPFKSVRRAGSSSRLGGPASTAGSSVLSETGGAPHLSPQSSDSRATEWSARTSNGSPAAHSLRPASSPQTPAKSVSPQASAAATSSRSRSRTNSGRESSSSSRTPSVAAAASTTMAESSNSGSESGKGGGGHLNKQSSSAMLTPPGLIATRARDPDRLTDQLPQASDLPAATVPLKDQQSDTSQLEPSGGGKAKLPASARSSAPSSKRSSASSAVLANSGRVKAPRPLPASASSASDSPKDFLRFVSSAEEDQRWEEEVRALEKPAQQKTAPRLDKGKAPQPPPRAKREQASRSKPGVNPMRPTRGGRPLAPTKPAATAPASQAPPQRHTPSDKGATLPPLKASRVPIVATGDSPEDTPESSAAPSRASSGQRRTTRKPQHRRRRESKGSPSSSDEKISPQRKLNSDRGSISHWAPGDEPPMQFTPRPKREPAPPPPSKKRIPKEARGVVPQLVVADSPYLEPSPGRSRTQSPSQSPARSPVRSRSRSQRRRKERQRREPSKQHRHDADTSSSGSSSPASTLRSSANSNSSGAVYRMHPEKPRKGTSMSRERSPGRKRVHTRSKKSRSPKQDKEKKAGEHHRHSRRHSRKRGAGAPFTGEGRQQKPYNFMHPPSQRKRHSKWNLEELEDDRLGHLLCRHGFYGEQWQYR